MSDSSDIRPAGRDDDFFTALRDAETELREAEARTVELAALVERNGLASRHGYPSTAHLLRDVARVSLPEAKRRLE